MTALTVESRAVLLTATDSVLVAVLISDCITESRAKLDPVVSADFMTELSVVMNVDLRMALRVYGREAMDGTVWASLRGALSRTFARLLREASTRAAQG